MKYFIAFLVAVFLVTEAIADTGHEGATRVEVGRSVQTASVICSSNTGTSFISASVKRPDGMYFNNSASTIFIGTTTATQNSAPHPNIYMGFPVLSSTTFSLGGSMTGAVACTCNVAVSACEIRSFEGLVP